MTTEEVARIKEVRASTIREVAQHVQLAIHMGTPAEEIPQVILDILKADKIAEDTKDLLTK